MMFASSARANERVHIYNVRGFPQGKLDREIIARFLLNEHGDLLFLLHNFGLHIILFRKQKKKVSLKAYTNPFLGDANL